MNHKNKRLICAAALLSLCTVGQVTADDQPVPVKTLICPTVVEHYKQANAEDAVEQLRPER